MVILIINTPKHIPSQICNINIIKIRTCSTIKRSLTCILIPLPCKPELHVQLLTEHIIHGHVLDNLEQ